MDALLSADQRRTYCRLPWDSHALLRSFIALAPRPRGLDQHNVIASLDMLVEVKGWVMMDLVSVRQA